MEWTTDTWSTKRGKLDQKIKGNMAAACTEIWSLEMAKEGRTLGEQCEIKLVN
jgi:hypothetical protein